jgi:hypothetical protein
VSVHPNQRDDRHEESEQGRGELQEKHPDRFALENAEGLMSGSRHLPAGLVHYPRFQATKSLLVFLESAVVHPPMRPGVGDDLVESLVGLVKSGDEICVHLV